MFFLTFQNNNKQKSYIKSSLSEFLNNTIGIVRDRNRQKRQIKRKTDENGAVMYIPISASSGCPVGTNSVADASVTGISQVNNL